MHVTASYTHLTTLNLPPPCLNIAIETLCLLQFIDLLVVLACFASVADDYVDAVEILYLIVS